MRFSFIVCTILQSNSASLKGAKRILKFTISPARVLNCRRSNTYVCLLNAVCLCGYNSGNRQQRRRGIPALYNTTIYGGNSRRMNEKNLFVNIMWGHWLGFFTSSSFSLWQRKKSRCSLHPRNFVNFCHIAYYYYGLIVRVYLRRVTMHITKWK